MHTSEDIISALIELEPIKTWSLIVTLFGDLKGEALTGKQLRSLLEPLGIKAEATRVALHRLRKDGWIESEKHGREVSFRLSDLGRRETDAAHPDVYRRDVKYPDGWRMLVVNEGAERFDKETPFIQVLRNIVMVPNVARGSNECERVGEGVLSVEIIDDCVPDWLQHRLVPKASLDVAQRLEPLAARFETIRPATLKIEATLARLLLLHHWRKLALRPGCWAHISLLPNGVISRCHKRVTRILAEGAPISVTD